jgi:hypothetical protein
MAEPVPLQAQRRRRILWTGAAVLLLIVFFFLGQRFGWGLLLDWTVVAIPAVVGFIAWVIPMKETRAKHKWMLFVGGVAFSGLLYLQQYLTRRAHAVEISNLATKSDIAKLPTAQDIVKELRKASTEEVTKEPGVPVKSKAKAKPATQENQGTGADVSKQLNDIKSMLSQQHWGLNAEQLVALSRRMAPFAQLKERGDLITCVLGDPDSTRFATSLVAAFRSAGWNLPGSGFSQAVFSGNVEGIVIQVHSREDKALGLLEFVTTLREAGINPIGELNPNIPVGEFQIIVGRKPA